MKTSTSTTINGTFAEDTTQMLIPGMVIVGMPGLSPTATSRR